MATDCLRQQFATFLQQHLRAMPQAAPARWPIGLGPGLAMRWIEDRPISQLVVLRSQRRTAHHQDRDLPQLNPSQQQLAGPCVAAPIWRASATPVA